MFSRVAFVFVVVIRCFCPCAVTLGQRTTADDNRRCFVLVMVMMMMMMMRMMMMMMIVKTHGILYFAARDAGAYNCLQHVAQTFRTRQRQL